jgi:hypothetical protein
MITVNIIVNVDVGVGDIDVVVGKNSWRFAKLLCALGQTLG